MPRVKDLLAPLKSRDQANTPAPKKRQRRGGEKKEQRIESIPDDEFLTTQEAAKLTKMSVAWYEKKRWEGQGPPYRKRGRAVRYLKSELLAWWGADRPTDASR